MEFQKIANFLDINSVNKDLPKFVAKKWIDEPNSSKDNNNITHSMLNSESLDCKAYLMENGETQNNLIKNNVKIVIPLKHLSNFWRNLNIPLINWEVELIFT